MYIIVMYVYQDIGIEVNTWNDSIPIHFATVSIQFPYINIILKEIPNQFHQN